jgi:putative tryptophan/tyrosine transport system substrate-binding protein
MVETRCAMKKAAAQSILFAVILLVVALIAEAQQQGKTATIGWLGIGSASSVARYNEFRSALRDLGYLEGKNLTFEYRSADNRLDRLPALADALVRLKVDLLITRGTPEALALKNATRTIPIVFYDVTDPVGAGLVDSLARPGGNVTGFSGIEAVLAGKRLELLKEVIPKLSRVAVLWNPQDLSSAQQWKGSQLPAQELGLQLYSMEVISDDKYPTAFKEAANARNDALAVIAGSLEDSNRKHIADLAAKNRLPAIYPRTVFVESGGLMSYGRDRDEAVRRVPAMVDKILKGTKPGELPVEQPTKFELVINLKTAKALSLTIPPVVLMRADRVIK